MEITEIFYSIQGESTYAGLPCVFVRLSGCNLRCSYCDTAYSYGQGEKISLDDLITKTGSYGCRLVEITGGEPLLQPEIPEFVSRLLEKGYKVLVETNGSLDIDIISRECVRIVDVKCPASGMSDRNNLSNIQKLAPHDQLKFVISDRGDFEYMKKILDVYKPACLPGSVLASPVTDSCRPGEIAAWILAETPEVRMQLQLHKYIWPGRDRGV